MPILVAIADQQSALATSSARLRQVVRRTLQAEDVRSANISVALVDAATMHRLNRRHLAHDYPTDVLSFRLSPTAVRPLEGEVVLCTDVALRQAAEYGWSPADELTLYLVHGLLHLCGHDDRRPRDRTVMRARERDILQIWGLLPHYDRSV